MFKHRTPTNRKFHLRRTGGRGMKVVVLTQFYAPEPHRLTPVIATALMDQGHDVSVVTGFPNRPGGKLHSEYKQRFGFSELLDGIPVHRVPLVVNHSRKALERIANFLSFSVSALTVTSKVRDADVVYVYGTPATAGIPAQVWKKIFGIPYVVHVQDLWPESVTDSKMLGEGLLSRTAAKVLNIWLKRFYGNAAALIAICPGMKRVLEDRGNAADRCSVVYNWAHESDVSVKTADSFSDSHLRLMYLGNLGQMQDLETVIAAARQFSEHPAFHLQIAGGGILENELRQAAADAEHIEFLGMLSREEAGQQAVEADFQLVTLKDLPIFRTIVPSKLQASLAAGVPVITTVQGDVAQLLTKYDAGIVAEPENQTSLTQAFQRAYEMTAAERAQMGANARKLYADHMSQASGTTELVSIIENAATKTNHQTHLKESR